MNWSRWAFLLVFFLASSSVSLVVDVSDPGAIAKLKFGLLVLGIRTNVLLLVLVCGRTKADDVVAVIASSANGLSFMVDQFDEIVSKLDTIITIPFCV